MRTPTSKLQAVTMQTDKPVTLALSPSAGERIPRRHCSRLEPLNRPGAEVFSLSSAKRRRGLGRGGMLDAIPPLSGSLPTRSSRGESDNAPVTAGLMESLHVHIAAHRGHEPGTPKLCRICDKRLYMRIRRFMERTGVRAGQSSNLIVAVEDFSCIHNLGGLVRCSNSIPLPPGWQPSMLVEVSPIPGGCAAGCRTR